MVPPEIPAASTRRSRRAEGAPAQSPTCAESWLFWQRWPRWDKCSREQRPGREGSRGCALARASGEKWTAPGSVNGSGSSSSGWRRSTMNTFSPESSCRLSDSGSRRPANMCLTIIWRRTKRSRMNPRIPSASSRPENLPAQSRRRGSRLSTSPKKRPSNQKRAEPKH